MNPINEFARRWEREIDNNFAAACFNDNGRIEIIEALRNHADPVDLSTWNISGEEYFDALKAAIKEKDGVFDDSGVRTVMVDDGAVGYIAVLYGPWTYQEIANAFRDGYSTGENEQGTSGTCEILDHDSDHINPVHFTITANGSGGVEEEIGDYPHEVVWLSY